MGRYGAIDVGTNTVRLLVADAEGVQAFRAVHEAQEITRLGEGLVPEKRLQAEPIRRTIAVAAGYADRARRLGAGPIAACATSAAREARNGDEFLEAARSAGIDIRVISEEEEARLTLLGVRHGLGWPPGTMLVFDIGGGSTELMLARDSGPPVFASLPLGAVKLTEQFLRSDPPTRADLARMGGAIREALRQLPAEIARAEHDLFVGTAGTITTLAAIDLRLPVYHGAKVTGHRMSLKRLMELEDSLASRSLAERRQVTGLEPGRADVIVAGAAVVSRITEYVCPGRDLVVSDGGLREGILLDLVARAPAAG